MTSILTTSDPLSITTTLKSATESADEKLYRHQQLSVKYFSEVSKNRGLLLSYQTGTGKSKTSAAIVDAFIKKKYRVVYLTPKSLQDNMIGELRAYYGGARLPPQISFVAYNSSRFLSTFYYATSGAQDSDPTIIAQSEKLIGKAITEQMLLMHKIPANYLIVIDEAHFIFNSITNGSKNATALYDIFLRSPSAKLLFLTGTPIVKDPFELAICYNMLAGKKLFPEDYTDFMDAFISSDDKSTRMINKAKFRNRIYGMTSYFGDYFFKPIAQSAFINADPDGKYTDEKYPRIASLKIVEVEMTAKMATQYSMVRKFEDQLAENNEKMAGQRRARRLQRPSATSGGLRPYSRQLGNIYIPEVFDSAQTFANALPDETASDEKIGGAASRFITLSSDILSNIGEYSPKAKAIMDIIDVSVTKPGVIAVYSNFVQLGVKVIAQLLDHKGFLRKTLSSEELAKLKTVTKDDDDIAVDTSSSYHDRDSLFSAEKMRELRRGADDTTTTATATPQKKYSYILITGEMSQEERTELIRQLNDSQDNLDGSRIKLVLFSKSGSTGLSFLRVRTMIVMEPDWSYSTFMQVSARGIRLNSHMLLSKDDRTIDIYMTLIKYPQKVAALSTDQFMYNRMIVKHRVNVDFLLCLTEASIECDELAKNTELECYRCAPTGAPLYTDNFYSDLAKSTPNPCQKVTEQKVLAKKIEFNGDTYYVAEKKVYYLDASSGKYIEMTLRTHPMVYPMIMKSIV